MWLVSFGERAFFANAYFKNNELAKEAREMLKHKDKESESSKTLFENVGSKVDFLQLIKSLVNDKNIVVNYYNHKLADVVSDVSYAEILQNDFIDSIKEVAKKTSDIKIKKAGDTREVNAKSIMAVMSLGVKKGETVTVSAEGEDEEKAVADMETFFKENL